MASLFEEYPGEIHFYHNRKPKYNGEEPLLGWSWLLYFVAVASSAVALFMILHGLVLDHIFKFLIELAIIVATCCHLFSESTHVVFSAPKKQVWSQFLWVKWNFIPFRDLADIKYRDQEHFGKTLYSYVVTRRNKFAPPVPLTFDAPDPDYLTLYAHHAIPYLESILPDDGASADEVPVEAVEVPVEKAEEMLHASQESVRSSTKAIRKNKLKFFSEKNGIFRISLWKNRSRFILWLVGIAGGGTILHYLQADNSAAYMLVGLYVSLIAFALIVLFDLNVDLEIDLKERLFLYKTKFGMRENAVPFESLITFNTKRCWKGQRLCMVLEDVMVDPTLCVSKSPDDIKAVYNEICAILNLNPNAWLDG